ncbi:MAG: hypothetical protein ING10_11480 [Roseomonas sp.]|nr:hypothetical protein [Roseomonas sp.]
MLETGRPLPGLKRHFWVMVLASFALLLPLAPSVAQTSMSERVVTEHRGFIEQPSLERYRIAFNDRSVRLVVPRNYLTHWVTAAMIKDSPGFMGIATLPEFSGATRENMDCFGGHALMRCDIVQFFYKDPVRPIEPNLTWYLRDRDLLVPGEYGLMGYPDRERYRVHFGEDGWIVQVTCSGERQPCQMFFPTAGADWRIQFRPALMPRWREIAEGLRVLIDGFAVPEAPAPQ